MVDYGNSVGSSAGEPKRRGREVKITPLDIRRKEFKRSMRGYSDEEVDVFLDEVADEFERLYQENGEMSERLASLEEQIAGYVSIKETLEKTLISAQMQADETRTNARKEAELILRDADLKSRQIVNDSYGETQRVQQALIQLKHLEEDFRFKFRSLLEAHLKLVEDAPLTVASVGPAGVGLEALVMPPAVVAPSFTEMSEAESDQGDQTAEVEAEPSLESEAEPESPTGVSQATETGPEPEAETITEEVAAPPDPAASTADELEADAVQDQAGQAPMGGFQFGQSLGGGEEDFFVLGRDKKEQDRDFEW